MTLVKVCVVLLITFDRFKLHKTVKLVNSAELHIVFVNTTAVITKLP